MNSAEKNKIDSCSDTSHAALNIKQKLIDKDASASNLNGIQKVDMGKITLFI